MIGGVGQDGGLARAAIEAALASQARAAQRVETRAAGSFDLAGSAPHGQAGRPVPAAAVTRNGIERPPLDPAAGGIQDLSELAARLKRSELTLRFALEVRDQLIDAYRETMRMSV